MLNLKTCQMILTQEGQGSFTDCGVYYKTLSAGMDVLLHSEESMPQNQQGPTICTKDLHLTHTPSHQTRFRRDRKIELQDISDDSGRERLDPSFIACCLLQDHFVRHGHPNAQQGEHDTIPERLGWKWWNNHCHMFPNTTHTHTPSFIRREREIDLQSGERQGQSFTFNMFCDMIAC